jgi:hypothetical protein
MLLCSASWLINGSAAWCCEVESRLLALWHCSFRRQVSASPGNQMSERLVLAFDGSITYSFVRAPGLCASVFGGPMEYNITAKRSPAPRLHHIARLSHNHLPILGPPRYVFSLPLLYGMCYSGWNLTYHFEHSNITLADLHPKKPTDDWPYRDYPVMLPYVPLEVAKRKKASWSQFAAEFPNMPENQPSELVVVVPPPGTIGVSLWGREGDGEGVALVFECDLEAKRVSTYNVCS